MKKKLSLRLPQINLLNRLNLKPKSAAYLMLATFFLVGGVYFVVVNMVSNKGTELRLLEVSNKDLEAQNQRLEVEAARLKSLQVIDENATKDVEVGSQDDAGSATLTSKPVTYAPPKLVPSQRFIYLPSYTALAQR